MLTFTGVVTQERDKFVALCPELDVASFGPSADEARRELLEAATLHIEGAIEDGLPYLRPVSSSEDPRTRRDAKVVDTFRFNVDVTVHAHT